VADQNLINAVAGLPKDHMFNQVVNRLNQYDGNLEALFRTTPGFDPTQTYSRSTPTALLDAVMGGDTRTQDQAAFLGQFPNAGVYDPPIEPAFMGMDTVTSAIVPKIAQAYGKQVLKNVPKIADKTTRALTGNLAGMKPTLEMTAYHGSPHKFDKFSMDKIGTGEGAQAYGHGLYFAENPKVAGQYAGDLVASRMPTKKNNVDLIELYQSEPKTPETMKEVLFDAKRFIDDGRLSKADESDFKALMKDNIDTASTKGNLYEVDIPDEHVANFLDWDAPLSEQMSVAKKLREIPSRDLQEAMQSFELGSTRGDTVYRIINRGFSEGENWAMKAAKKMGHDPYSAEFGALDSKKLASDFLDSLGIKGIKYYDGGSRAAGEGTRNLVVFDDSIIKTLKRNDEELLTGIQSAIDSGDPQAILDLINQQK